MDLVPTAEAKAELEKKAELDSIVSCKKEACPSLALHLSHTSQRLTQGPTSHINHSSRPLSSPFLSCPWLGLPSDLQGKAITRHGLFNQSDIVAVPEPGLWRYFRSVGRKETGLTGLTRSCDFAGNRIIRIYKAVHFTPMSGAPICLS